MNKLLDISKEVREALNANKPVVALESTIISHGMPYPQNVEMANECERIIRNNGAIPATICIMDGKIKIGLNKDELHKLATAETVLKASRKDLAYIIANNNIGATTVATTMYAASLANIKVFATGGIGGVHRGAEITMDISADLEELSKTNVAVICAGIKSILDLPKTLEYLETKGVEVIGYKTAILPEFYTTGRNYNVNYQMNSEIEIANFLRAKQQLGLQSGCVITNPIQKEYAMDYDLINNAINKAIEEMNKNNVSGYESTPFLLGKIKEITDGKSLESNIALVYNNAKLAAKIAVELYK
ncbi:MAG: pseudouridine-5'-phosphate glycosidase [Bacilli bacterium]